MTAADVSEAPTLLLPPGWMIDPLALDRLAARLGSCADDIVAIVAPLSVPPAGASYRTHAERAGLLPIDAAFVTSDPVDGAALVVRAPHRCTVADGVVTVTEGLLLVDPGAPVHDPLGGVATAGSATADGRSPFPRRPIVVFVGLEHDVGGAVWARNLVNDLISLDVEARLAVTPTPDGPHLTGPCLPTAASLRALRPDVVVTLDDTAADRIQAWCDQRSTIVVQHTGERTLGTELVSWRIGEADGRLRALVGRAATAPELAALVSRLTSGPMPIAPRVDDEGELLVASPTNRPKPPATRPRLAVVRGPKPAGSRIEALLAEAAALGAHVHTCAADADLTEHDAVLLAADLDLAAGEQIARGRALVGRKTIVDVSQATVPDLAIVCGAATASRAAVHGALAAAGIPVRTLPLLLTRSRLDALRGARVELESHDQRVVGVRVDAAEQRQVSALSGAVDQLLHTDPELLVECVGLTDELPQVLREHPRVTIRPELPIDQIARWRAQAWIGSDEGAEQVGRPTVLTESAYLGVPTVFGTRTRGDIDDDVVCRHAITSTDDAASWWAALQSVLTADPVPARSSLASRADLLFGPKAGMSIVNRIIGWAGFTGIPS